MVFWYRCGGQEIGSAVTKRGNPFIRTFIIGWMDNASCFGGARITSVGSGGFSWWHAGIRVSLVHVDISCVGWSMSCDYDQSSVKFRFSFSHKQDCRRALTGTGHSVVLHCLGSARLICHEIYQFGFQKARWARNQSPQVQSLPWGRLLGRPLFARLLFLTL